MKRILFLFLMIIGLFMIPESASAQTINGVCINNSYTCNVFPMGTYGSGTWLAIYGTNLPTQNGTKVWVWNGPSKLYYNTITPAYVSTTQINFQSATSPSSNGQVYIEVCSSYCTNLYGPLTVT